MSSRAERLADQLLRSRRSTLDVLVDVDPRDFTLPPLDGANDVHWTLAHLMEMDMRGAAALGRIAPPPADVDASHRLFVDSVRALSDADLDAPPAASLAELFPTLETMLVAHIWHDGYHAGQLALIRRRSRHSSS